MLTIQNKLTIYSITVTYIKVSRQFIADYMAFDCLFSDTECVSVL